MKATITPVITRAKRTKLQNENETKCSKKKARHDKNITDNVLNESFNDILQTDTCDGVKVTLGSDEELDYIDDVLENEETVSENSEACLRNSPTSQEEEQLMGNPHIKKLLNKMLDERIEQEFTRRLVESSKSTILTTPQSKGTLNIFNTPVKDVGKNMNTNRANVIINSAERTKIKSPSDTTVYVPGLRREIINPQLTNVCKSPPQVVTPHARMTVDQDQNIFTQVSNFVDEIREQSDVRRIQNREEQQQVMEMNDDGDQFRRRSEVTIPGLKEARTRTDRTIIEAEKFKASIEKPPGEILDKKNGDFNMFNQEVIVRQSPNQPNSLNELMGNFPQQIGMDLPNQKRKVIGEGLSDDDFFHLTCHIDDNLKSKIERGGFVDLDKLLPTERFGFFDGRNGFSDDGKLEWVQREGATFLMPAKKNSRITSFRKWEQAFRAYATIYCGANPARAREIWQYISVINTASLNFSWENVYSYDIIFRQLMEFNPARSWAVTYNQMWNLTMTNPIQKFQNNKSHGNFSNFQNKQAQGGRRPKSDYCWGFNKGLKCKFGKNCKFIERCSYCDSPAHGVIACPKLEKRDHNGAGNNNQRRGLGKHDEREKKEI